MPSGGLDLARPPVQVWRKVTQAHTATLLHGANWWSMGAGGFGQVPALPNLFRVRSPANANSQANARYSEIYATRGVPTRANLAKQFGTI